MKLSTSPSLVLASSSRYRQELLSRLKIPFTIQHPDINETAYANEAPEALAMRLAHTKAQVVANNMSQAFVIGSDQVAIVDNLQLNKPGDYQQALKQLQFIRGKTIQFHTTLCLIAPNMNTQTGHVLTKVTIAPLSDAELKQYLQIESPYDVAGGIKFESLGIALAKTIETQDPTALTGLPLIALCNMLRQAGFPLLQN